MPPVLVTAPTERPISAEQVLACAETLEGVSSATVEALIDAAVSTLDGWSGILGRCLVEQTWAVESRSCAGRVRIPFLDVIEVTKVGLDGELVSPDGYRTYRDALGTIIELQSGAASLSTGEGLTVTFTAGYGAPDKVPAAIKQAIVLMVVGMHAQSSADGRLRSFAVEAAFSEGYNSPEQQVAANAKAVDTLLAPFRRMAV